MKRDVAEMVLNGEWSNDGECPECGGYGFVKRANQGYGKSSLRKCPLCKGSGKILMEVRKDGKENTE